MLEKSNEIKSIFLLSTREPSIRYKNLFENQLMCLWFDLLFCDKHSPLLTICLNSIMEHMTTDNCFKPLPLFFMSDASYKHDLTIPEMVK